jgi:hypothetical protein
VTAAVLFNFTHSEPYLPVLKGYSRDVPPLARVLRDEVGTGDRVLVVVPYDKPLEYYLVKYGVAVPDRVALNGRPRAGERIWLVKPVSLSHRDALREIPGPRIASFENLDAVAAQLTEWRYVAGSGRLQLWSARVTQHAVAHLARSMQAHSARSISRSLASSYTNARRSGNCCINSLFRSPKSSTTSTGASSDGGLLIQSHWSKGWSLR